MDKKTQILQDEIQKIVNHVSERKVEADIFLSPRQLDIISQLNHFSTHKILNDIEVCKDPRKIAYKTNQELKLALVALCLSVVLTKHRSKNFYDKEYLENNILVENISNGTVFVGFNQIEEYIVDEAIDSELVFDWMVYGDFQGRGISALINEKMCDIELEGYNSGGCPVYEFARFQRKYFDYKRRKQNKDKAQAQDTFRNAIVQQVANQIAAQQLMNGNNPLDLVNLLFDSKDYDKALRQLTKSTTENPDKILKISHNKK